MTRLTKPVRRVVRLDRRDYVVTLVPAAEPLVMFRELRRRHVFTRRLEDVLAAAARTQADNLRAERRARRRDS